MQRTSGRGIVEQQHTGDDVFRLDGARDGRVRNKVLRGALEGEMEMIRSASPSRSHLIANCGSAHYRHLQTDQMDRSNWVCGTTKNSMVACR